MTSLSRLRNALVAFAVLVPTLLALAGPAYADAALTVTPAGPIGPVPVGATPTSSFVISPNPEGATISLAWTVRAGTAVTDAVVRSGSVDVTPDVDGMVALTFETPPELGEGSFGLEVVASGDLPGIGTASGSSGILPVLVDNPAEVSASVSKAVVYPVRDRYQDTVVLTVEANESVAVRVAVVNSTGTARTLTYLNASPDLAATLTWDGRLSSGGGFPAGSYLLRAVVTDAAGQVTVDEVPVEISLAELRMVTSPEVYTPKKTLSDRFVGRCSSLVSPSSHGWAKSQGYNSLSKCGKTAKNADVVVGVHAWWLPPSVRNKYSLSLRVDTFGGKAKGESWAYLVHGYYRRSDNAFVGRTQLSPRVAWHRGRWITSRSVIRYATNGAPYVFWSSGLAEGSKYDVKSFRIVVGRQVLMDTDGTILLPRADARSARPALPAARSMSGRPFLPGAAVSASTGVPLG